jgi:hypothetical protein
MPAPRAPLQHPGSSGGLHLPRPGSRPARAIAHVEADASGGPVDPALRVTLHFHPDRLHLGVPILRAMRADGIYRSQFETRTSNGGLTAHVGGDRWRWESRIFGGAYDDAPPPERPKYGSLNVHARRAGGSPRFGSAHFRLRPAALARTTFCYPDSFFHPTHFGTAARMALIEVAAADAGKDALDDYIEAQVHGLIVLARDVEALVLDPCFAGSDVERAARDLPCAVEWHDGFRLAVRELEAHPDYRGPATVALGRALADRGLLTARVVGEAARTGADDPERARALKHLWHCIARLGA